MMVTNCAWLVAISRDCPGVRFHQHARVGWTEEIHAEDLNPFDLDLVKEYARAFVTYLDDHQKTSCPHCADEKGRQQPRVDRLRVALANVVSERTGMSWGFRDLDEEPESEGEVEVTIRNGKVVIDCDMKEKGQMPILTVRARSGLR